MYFIKPKSGLLVMDPKTNKPVPTEGYWVIKSKYWDRRLQEGAVERVRTDTGEKVELDQEIDFMSFIESDESEIAPEPKRPRRRLQKAS